MVEEEELSIRTFYALSFLRFIQKKGKIKKEIKSKASDLQGETRNDSCGSASPLWPLRDLLFLEYLASKDK